MSDAGNNGLYGCDNYQEAFYKVRDLLVSAESKLDAAEKALNQPVLLSEWQQQQALLAAARKAAGMFASVIKSGERWSEHCQSVFDAAFPEAPK